MARPVQVKALNIPALTDVSTFALSADGTRLAVSTATVRSVALTVYTVATGAARTWSESTHQGGHYRWLGVFGEPWVEGDKVEVALVANKKGGGGPVGLLDTSLPGGSLSAGLRVFPPGPCSKDTLTPDGNLGIGAVPSKGGIPWRLQECAISHGHARVTVPGRTIYYRHQPVDLSGEFWLSPTGTTILADGVAGSAQAPATAVTGPLAGNQIEALPGPTIPQLNIYPGQSAAW